MDEVGMGRGGGGSGPGRSNGRTDKKMMPCPRTDFLAGRRMPKTAGIPTGALAGESGRNRLRGTGIPAQNETEDDAWSPFISSDENKNNKSEYPIPGVGELASQLDLFSPRGFTAYECLKMSLTLPTPLVSHRG
jgi:hypothetical protein